MAQPELSFLERMKRKNAIHFFGSMTTLTVGYIVWSARVFYVQPNIEFDQDITPEARNEVAKWMNAHPGYYSVPFDWDRFAGELCNPYRNSLPPVVVTHHFYPTHFSREEMFAYRKGHKQIVRFFGAGNDWLEPIVY